jgi:hypothetical protein
LYIVRISLSYFWPAGPVFNADGVPIHMGAELLFPGGRRGHFECGFDRVLTQYLEVAGTVGSILLHDFTIPRDELVNSFVVTARHGLAKLDLTDVTVRSEHIVRGLVVLWHL